MAEDLPALDEASVFHTRPAAPISTARRVGALRWRIATQPFKETDDDPDRASCPGRWLLLGDAGPDPQEARRHLHPRWLFRRRCPQRHLSQPRDPCRGDRDRL